MTKTQFRRKTKQLKKDVNKLIDSRIEKLLNSGCVDLNDYEDNYLLPKIFICAMGEEIKHQFRPYSAKDQREVKNIEKFL